MYNGEQYELLSFINIFFGSAFMNVQVGDRVEMKKPHPCGGKSFEILRVGMDFKIKCESCGREVMVPRNKIEKNIKKIL